MDWGRAKSVLIFAFLLLNVLLGYNIWTDVREGLYESVDSAELPPDKLQLMQQKRISLAANLPIHTPELADLTYILRGHHDGGIKKVKLAHPVNSALVFSKTELVKELSDQIDDLNKYVYDLPSSRDGVFVLYRTVDGYPMFNVKLELFNSNLKITGFQQERMELVSTGEAKQVIPASKIIASLIETYLEDGTTISDIQLGYHGQVFDSDKQVSAPTWRVMLEDGKVFYVNAISGEVTTDAVEQSVGFDEVKQ
ncbi:two-component system regulatory protein YycI [Paenibacillus yanchengensis]|uniref:Two-component system regulatory protein YycI n=1 Tax=Paenibacillus yanchengensis TaxID=2035833 RepID=A0ABW4YPG8_9BACL